jgi:plastocyanin
MPTIELEIDAQGNPVYHPAALRARIGETIHWKFRGNGAFAVLFRKTPFDYVEFNPARPGAEVRGPPGVYSYAVALVSIVEVKGEKSIGPVVLDAGCPEIIIQR